MCILLRSPREILWKSLFLLPFPSACWREFGFGRSNCQCNILATFVVPSRSNTVWKEITSDDNRGPGYSARPHRIRALLRKVHFLSQERQHCEDTRNAGRTYQGSLPCAGRAASRFPLRTGQMERPADVGPCHRFRTNLFLPCLADRSR